MAVPGQGLPTQGLDLRGESARDAALPAAATGTGRTAPALVSGWQPRQLDARFSLDDALDDAMRTVTRRMNWNLRPDGLVVHPTQAAAQNIADTRLQVTDMQTQAVLREYDVPTFLGLYAAREKSCGVVVDGRV